MAKFTKIPEATIRRLSSYLKCMVDLEGKSEKVASSAVIASICNVNAAQVRKDFAYFGEFGIRGMGYNVKDLKRHIKEILGINREWRIAVVGVGNMGAPSWCTRISSNRTIRSSLPLTFTLNR
jgi:redox-sensing transcriptional repressor